MEWGMGCVFVYNAKGKDITECKTVQKMFDAIEDVLFDTNPCCSAEWEAMSSLGTGEKDYAKKLQNNEI
jgi:hypothetical protein